MNEFAELVLFLRCNIYNKQENINTFYAHLNNHLDIMDIKFSSISYCFEMKIKKSSMKKNEIFENNSRFYYPIVSKVYEEFLKDPIIQSQLGEYKDKFNSLPLSGLLRLINNVALLDNILFIYV